MKLICSIYIGIYINLRKIEYFFKQIIFHFISIYLRVSCPVSFQLLWYDVNRTRKLNVFQFRKKQTTSQKTVFQKNSLEANFFLLDVAYIFHQIVPLQNCLTLMFAA